MALINSDLIKNSPKKVLEVGGIDRPLLSKSNNYKYYGMDIESRTSCFEIYDAFIVQSIEQSAPDLIVDLIISITLLEHVPNNRAAVSSMYEMLIPGGRTYHYVPSKWHPYSIALRAVGPKLQKRLIALLRPAAVEVTGYPAFFDHCSPSAMRSLFLECGFESIEVRAFWRAADYFAFFLPAYILVAMFENICSLFRIKFFASGFIVRASRPI